MRHATSNWVWSQTYQWEFSKDKYFIELRLPRLTELLSHDEIRIPDDLVLSVEVGSAAGLPAAIPNRVIMPESTVAALKALVDSPIGDVMFLCLEHSHLPVGLGEELKYETLSRKRVLYAHSDVLRSKGRYFADLLTGGFSESEGRKEKSRVTPIMVDDAGFDTVYWVLR
jgi:hypothetical protein